MLFPFIHLSPIERPSIYFEKNRLETPAGIDKNQYEVTKNDKYDFVRNRLLNETRSSLSSDKTYCFYCGTKTNLLFPAFPHDGSGNNTWILKDWRYSFIICNQCYENYGMNNVRYFGRVEDIIDKKPEKILAFEPEILLPGIEPTHLHFEYNSNGYLVPITERAKTTINAFNLNRNELIERRLISMSRSINEDIGIAEMESPYDALFVINKNNIDDYIDDIERFNRRGLYQFIDFDIRIPYKSITFRTLNKTNKSNYATSFSGVKSFKFSGIRGFKQDQNITFKGKNNIVVLGENGVGKSTLLELFKRSMKTNYKRKLNDLCDNPNTTPEYEIIYYNDKFKYRYHEGYEHLGKRDKCNLVYISETRSSSKIPKYLADWINLHTSSSKEFVYWIARKLKILLDLPQDYFFCTINGQVYWETNENFNGRKYIYEFSSGYNSLLTIFYKILSSVSSNNSKTELRDILSRLSSSIVLIDEIELHLHPKFKKDVIRCLHDTFPEVLFIMTTHDPLVLSSAPKNTSVILLKKENNQTFLRDDLPDHSSLSTEQILTSPHFSLDTLSTNRELEKNIKEYHFALANEDWDTVDILRDILSNNGLLGRTYREYIALSAVDLFIAIKGKTNIGEIIEYLASFENNEGN